MATETFTCANCEIAIDGQPTTHVGVAFCCAGCVAGGPCTCSYDVSPRLAAAVAVEWQVRDCLDITALDESDAVRPRELVSARR